MIRRRFLRRVLGFAAALPVVGRLVPKAESPLMGVDYWVKPSDGIAIWPHQEEAVAIAQGFSFDPVAMRLRSYMRVDGKTVVDVTTPVHPCLDFPCEPIAFGSKT